MANLKQEIINKITALSTAKSPYEVYNDWVKCMALSIVNACTLPWGKVWKEREEYNDILLVGKMLELHKDDEIYFDKMERWTQRLLKFNENKED